MKVALWRIAHARSGDKADRADIGLFAFDAQTYTVLKREVTRERLAAHFAARAAGRRGAQPADGQPRQERRRAIAANVKRGAGRPAAPVSGKKTVAPPEP